VFVVKKKVFWYLQRVAVAKTLSSVILAYGLGILFEEVFSQLELVLGSLHTLLFNKYLHLVEGPWSLLYSFDVGLAFLCLSSVGMET
jgi:hypothetical protein